MREKLWYAYIWFDYEVMLPFFAALPNRLGRFLAKLRGIAYFYMKRDWRIFVFGDSGLWDRSFESFRAVFPNACEKEIRHLVKERFIYQCYEEFEAAKINNRSYMKIPVEYVGKDGVDAYLKEHGNAIFATCHFGSIVGLINLNVFGKAMMHMASNITKQACVHPSIKNFYIKKYLIGDEYMNGGEIIDIEGNSKLIFKFVKKGGSLSSVADLPAPDPHREALWQKWFGKERAMASGIHRLSKKTDTKIIPYVCYYQKGRYVMKFANLEEGIYDFFEKEIRQRPGMWWAADLLSHYSVRG